MNSGCLSVKIYEHKIFENHIRNNLWSGLKYKESNPKKSLDH